MDQLGAIEPAAGPGLEAASPPPAQPIAWPESRSCGELVDALATMAPDQTRRLDPAGAVLGVALADRASPRLEADLPLAELKRADLAAQPCALLVGAAIAQPAAADKVLERRTVHSSYRTGTKRRRNPEHQALEKELNAARRESDKGTDILGTGDPLLDLIGIVAGGIIGGVDALLTRNELDELEATLDSTPAFIEDPILTPYRYELVDLEAERRFALPVALYDGDQGAIWRTRIELAERRRFAVLEGRHPEDEDGRHDAAATPVTPAELAIWRDTPPPLATSALLAHVAAATQESSPIQTASAAAALAQLGERNAIGEGPERGPATEPALRMAVAEGAAPTPTRSAASGNMDAMPEPAAGPLTPDGASVRPLSAELLSVGQEGLPGFYITAEHIVTPLEALGHSSLVAVRYPDGMQAHGLVEIEDAALGLAIVFLPRPGEALSVAAASSEAPAASGRAGAPWGDGRTVSGLFVTDPETDAQRWVDGADLERLLARLDRL